MRTSGRAAWAARLFRKAPSHQIHEKATALTEAGVTAVLTGGSAATFYAPHAYQSGDLDFVVTMPDDEGKSCQGLTPC